MRWQTGGGRNEQGSYHWIDVCGECVDWVHGNATGEVDEDSTHGYEKRGQGRSDCIMRDATQ